MVLVAPQMMFAAEVGTPKVKEVKVNKFCTNLDTFLVNS